VHFITIKGPFFSGLNSYNAIARTTILEGMKLLRKENLIWSRTVSYQRRDKYILSLFLNTASDEADVTPLGRPFHTFAPATGKARPPTVDRRQVGTSSRSVEVDLRRCGMSATRRQV